MASSREVKCTACEWSAVRGAGNGVLVEPCPACGARVRFAELWPGEMPHSAAELIPINPRTGKGWTDPEEDVISQVMLAEGYDRIKAIQEARRHKLIGTGSVAFLSGAASRADWPLEAPRRALRATEPTLARPRTKPPTLPTIKRALPSPLKTAPTAPYSPDPATDRPERLTDSLTGVSEQNEGVSEHNFFSERDTVSEQRHLEVPETVLRGLGTERQDPASQDLHDASVNLLNLPSKTQALAGPQAIATISPDRQTKNLGRPVTGHPTCTVIEMPKKNGRPRKWHSDAERMATAREQQKPLILPPLPQGVYRAREVVTATGKSSPSSTARRNYHAALQEHRCFFCERQFGSHVQKNSAKPEALRVEDEHFIPRRLPGARKDDNRHAVCHICNKLKSDLVFRTEEQCRDWLAQAWILNGYQEIDIHAIQYHGKDGSVVFEERLAEEKAA